MKLLLYASSEYVMHIYIFFVTSERKVMADVYFAVQHMKNDTSISLHDLFDSKIENCVYLSPKSKLKNE